MLFFIFFIFSVFNGCCCCNYGDFFVDAFRNLQEIAKEASKKLEIWSHSVTICTWNNLKIEHKNSSIHVT